MENIEIWKDIEWHEWKYQVSSVWNIKSLKFGKERIMKCKIWINNYCGIYLSYKYYYIHRLVAQEFLWLDINNKKICVCHKDDNPINNNVDNLFLWTHKENTQDMMKKWRGRKRSMKIIQYSRQWEFIKEWSSIIEASKYLWIPSWNICYCCQGRFKIIWWFIWKYSK